MLYAGPAFPTAHTLCRISPLFIAAIPLGPVRLRLGIFSRMSAPSLPLSLSFSLFLPSCFPSLIRPLKALSPSQLRIWWWFPSSRQRPLCSLVGSHLRIKFHIQFCSNPLLPPILSEQAGPVSFFVYFSFIPTISPSVLCVLFFKPSPPFQLAPSCQLAKVPPLLLLSTPPTSSFSLPTYQPSVPHTFAVMIQLITSTAHITHLHCV